MRGKTQRRERQYPSTILGSSIRMSEAKEMLEFLTFLGLSSFKWSF